MRQVLLPNYMIFYSLIFIVFDCLWKFLGHFPLLAYFQMLWYAIFMSLLILVFYFLNCSLETMNPLILETHNI